MLEYENCSRYSRVKKKCRSPALSSWLLHLVVQVHHAITQIIKREPTLVQCWSLSVLLSSVYFFSNTLPSCFVEHAWALSFTGQRGAWASILYFHWMANVMPRQGIIGMLFVLMDSKQRLPKCKEMYDILHRVCRVVLKWCRRLDDLVKEQVGAITLAASPEESSCKRYETKKCIVLSALLRSNVLLKTMARLFFLLHIKKHIMKWKIEMLLAEISCQFCT